MESVLSHALKSFRPRTLSILKYYLFFFVMPTQNFSYDKEEKFLLLKQEKVRGPRISESHNNYGYTQVYL